MMATQKIVSAPQRDPWPGSTEPRTGGPHPWLNPSTGERRGMTRRARRQFGQSLRYRQAIDNTGGSPSNEREED